MYLYICNVIKLWFSFEMYLRLSSTTTFSGIENSDLPAMRKEKWKERKYRLVILLKSLKIDKISFIYIYSKGRHHSNSE